ncbi:MAG TPA: NAD(P)H-dependent glycerol-3-phosphate dehydrogenase [Alphaproteobacteria bacterium]
MAAIARIEVIGAGAWGTALAALAAERGHETVLWALEPEVAVEVNEKRTNTPYLPGVTLPDRIAATAEIAEMGRGDAVLLVTPAQHLREVAGRLAPRLAPGMPLVVCAKGIEERTGLLLSEVLAEVAPEAPRAVLSGPTLAGEVARGMPAAVTIAAEDASLAAALVSALGSTRFRPYAGDDPVGCQIGGAVKNVMAIACGIVAGLGLGENARAALMTRGLAEMTRLAIAKGGKLETLMGLSGIGDLALTCAAEASRNYSLGLAVGRGKSAAEVLAGRRSVAEGATTAGAVLRLAASLGVEMPIAAAVNRVVQEGADIPAMIEELMARPFKREAVGR